MEQDMLNENSNELNWKNKLGDMDCLSGEVLPDKNAVWEKLHSRLHQEPRRVKPLWYWAAAACLLTAILLLTINKKPADLVKNTPVKSLHLQPIISQVSPIKESVMVPTPSNLNNKIAISQPKVKINHGQPIPGSLFTSKVTASKGLAGQEEQKQVPATMEISAIAPVVEMQVENTTAAVPAGKRLKVVHINELGDPVEEAHNLLPPSDYGSVKIMLINQQVYTVSSVPSNSIGFNVSKNKNTQPN